MFPFIKSIDLENFWIKFYESNLINSHSRVGLVDGLNNYLNRNYDRPTYRRHPFLNTLTNGQGSNLLDTLGPSHGLRFREYSSKEIFDKSDQYSAHYDNENNNGFYTNFYKKKLL